MIEYEIVKHDRLKDVRIFINSIRLRSVHMHRDLELFLVLEGEGTVIIKNQKHSVRRGDTLLINAYDSHEIIALTDTLTLLIIQFSNHFLREYYHAMRNTVFLNNSPKSQFPEAEYEKLLDDMIRLSNDYLREEHLFELSCVHYLSDIIYMLYRYMDTAELSETEYTKRKKQNRRVDRISSYISENYQGPLRLSDIAEMEGITTTHLSHFFTENFGMTFQEYLRDKRLECAIRLIGDDSLTVSEIASSSGFSELKYMTKAFKEAFGMSPSLYRENKVINLPANKKADISEYIHSKDESLSILSSITVKSML